MRVITLPACIFVAGLLLAADGPVPRPAGNLDKLEGVYRVEGKEGASHYAGIVVLRKRGEGYAVQSMTAADTLEGQALGNYLGIGLVDGDRLSVSWQNGSGRALGITVYKIGKAGLTGRWILLQDADEVRSETLTRMADLPKPPAE